jgi:hypothetical protein
LIFGVRPTSPVSAFFTLEGFGIIAARRRMAFKLKDRVRRIGQHEVCTVEDIREPDDHILRLNSAAETMYWIQLGSDFDTHVLAKESELEIAE